VYHLWQDLQCDEGHSGVQAISRGLIERGHTVPSVAGGLSDTDPRLALLHALREQSYCGKIAVAMRTDYDEEVLRQRGADIVLSPFIDAATFAVASVESLLQEA
jgi:hypothetical protein